MIGRLLNDNELMDRITDTFKSDGTFPEPTHAIIIKIIESNFSPILIGLNPAVITVLFL